MGGEVWDAALSLSGKQWRALAWSETRNHFTIVGGVLLAIMVGATVGLRERLRPMREPLTFLPFVPELATLPLLACLTLVILQALPRWPMAKGSRSARLLADSVALVGSYVLLAAAFVGMVGFRPTADEILDIALITGYPAVATVLLATSFRVFRERVERDAPEGAA